MGKPLAFPAGGLGNPPLGDLANAVVLDTITAIGPGIPFCFQGPFTFLAWSFINTALTTSAGSLTATVASGAGLAAGDNINSTLVPPGTTVGSVSTNTITLLPPPISQYGQVTTANAEVTGLPYTTGLLGATVTGPGIPASTTVTAINVAAVQTTSFSNVPPTLGTITLSNTPTIASIPVIGGEIATPLIFYPTANAILSSATDTASTFTGAAITASGTIQLEKSIDGGKIWLVCNVGGLGILAQYSTLTPLSVSIAECEVGAAYRVNATAWSSGSLRYRFSTTGNAAQSISMPSVI